MRDSLRWESEKHAKMGVESPLADQSPDFIVGSFNLDASNNLRRKSESGTGTGERQARRLGE